MEGHKKEDTIFAEAGPEKRKQQILSAGTLPSVLRLLTDINSSSQYDLWSFLLHIRQYSTAKYILQFLQNRYLLDTDKIREYVSDVSLQDNHVTGEGGDLDIDDWLDSQLKRHVLGKELFGGIAKDLAYDFKEHAMSFDAESDPPLSEFCIEIKLGVLFLLETWLSCFPEDFIGAPEEYTPDGVESEVKDDWHHRASSCSRDAAPPDSIYGEGVDRLKGLGTAAEEEIRQEDALDLLIDMVESCVLPCPMMILLGSGHLWVPPSEHSTSHPFQTEKPSSPFAQSFPCLYKVAYTVHLELNNVSSARMLSLDGAPAEGTVIRSNRNDGYDRSIIPLAVVICSINARSRLQRISQDRMASFYESKSSVHPESEALSPSEENTTTSGAAERPSLTSHSSSSKLSTCGSSSFCQTRPRRLSRHQSVSRDFNYVADFQPWYKAEMQQLSELRTSITQILATESMRCMNLVMEQYHPVVVTLRAAEMAAAEQDFYSDSCELPVKVFVSPIDKQILTYKYSKTKGFSGVAATMVALKHNFDDGNRESNTIGVNLTEAMRGYDSGESDDEGPIIQDSPFYSMSSSFNDGGTLPGMSGTDSPSMRERESTAIVVDEELGRQLHELAKEEEKTLVRPILLWRRRKKRKELQKKLEKWKAENKVPLGIDTCQGHADGVLKAHVVRGLTATCKNSPLFMFAPSLLAYNMTLKLHYLYCTIPLLEFAVYAGFSTRSRREVPMLSRFRRECDRLQEFFVDEVLSEVEPMSRATLIINLIQVGEAAARLWSHHLLMLVVQALQCHAIHRLKDTWKLVDSSYPDAWKVLQECTGFGGSSLLSAQMDKFLAFGLSDDYRKNIYVQNPDNSSDDMNTDALLADVLGSIEGSVSRAMANGILVSPVNSWQVDKRTETIVPRETSSRPLGSPPWYNRRRFTETLAYMPEDKLYLGCGFSTAGKSSPSTNEMVLVEPDEAVALSSIPEVGIGEGLIIDKSISVDRPTASIALKDSDLIRPPSVENYSLEAAAEEAKASMLKHAPSSTTDGPSVQDNDDEVIESAASDDSKLFPLDIGHDNISASMKFPSSSSIASGSFLRGHTGSGAFAAGIVRDDASADLMGLPKPAPQAGMPYLNGVMSKLIRLSELPEYMRDAENPDEMLFVKSPGLFESDQKLPLINFGKLRSVARWMLLLRCTQLTPYKYDEKAVILDLHAMLLKPPGYKGQDAQWERSLFLEKKKSSS